jgi:hypothetical protein
MKLGAVSWMISKPSRYYKGYQANLRIDRKGAQGANRYRQMNLYALELWQRQVIIAYFQGLRRQHRRAWKLTFDWGCAGAGGPAARVQGNDLLYLDFIPMKDSSMAGRNPSS